MVYAYVYILTNANKSTLYVGSTTDLPQRIMQHRSHIKSRFAARYNLTRLVYFEEYGDIREAIVRERQIKGRSHDYKISLVNAMNPTWKDLMPPEDE